MGTSDKAKTATEIRYLFVIALVQALRMRIGQ